jgi:uncharacterized membrane protein (UPF0127 family)
MDRRGLAIVVALALLGIAALAVLGSTGGGTAGPPSSCANYTADYGVDRSDTYNRTTVALLDIDGTELATVGVRIADTADKRRTGLSETASLADGEGMLFVHPEEGRHTYWMRGMSFPIDIVFATAAGEVTTIHHAATPAELDVYGEYPGRGMYVLEVPRGYTNATGLDVGDCLAVPSGVSAG